MSTTNDVRSYADAALEQGKHVVDQAQTRLTDVARDASEAAEKVQDRAHDLATKASRTYGELRERVTSLPGVETVSSTVEPYLERLNEYRITLTEKVEELYGDLKKNAQIAKMLAPAEHAANMAMATVNERVVKPVRSLAEPERPKRQARKPAAKATPIKATPAKRAAPRRATTTA